MAGEGEWACCPTYNIMKLTPTQTPHAPPPPSLTLPAFDDNKLLWSSANLTPAPPPHSYPQLPNMSGLTAASSGDHVTYDHPLVTRYASSEMSFMFSPTHKFSTWRKLWVALAKGEKTLGLDITQEQVDEMEKNIFNIDYDYAAQKEKEFRHDVMGHVHAFGHCCPSSMPIIHLGATSCYVGDNTDLIQMRDALGLIKRKLVKVIDVLGGFAVENKSLPTLGFTHYQPAQLTTVGKRATLWLQDLLLDFEKIEREIETMPFRGVKGTTGTQASFLELFDGDHAKVKKLDKLVCAEMGFQKSIGVSGQTYTRKLDYHILTLLSGIGQSAYKMCGDIRLLANLKEVEEPFSKNQIGSSAMAYKRNPMRSERVCSLSRYLIGLPASAANTAAGQWFERTLDDSAIRRIIIPEAFLSADVILTLLADISSGLHVWPNVVRLHVMAELPFMATEVILMECVKRGGDRQELHEAIRVHSMAAGAVVKGEGKPNDLMERIAKDKLFECVWDKLDAMIEPSLFVGRAPEQVDDFMEDEVTPILERCADLLKVESKDAVNC